MRAFGQRLLAVAVRCGADRCQRLSGRFHGWRIDPNKPRIKPGYVSIAVQIDKPILACYFARILELRGVLPAEGFPSQSPYTKPRRSVSQRVVHTVTEKDVRIRFAKESLSFTGEDSLMVKLMLSVMGAICRIRVNCCSAIANPHWCIRMPIHDGSYRKRSSSMASGRQDCIMAIEAGYVRYNASQNSSATGLRARSSCRIFRSTR